MARQVSSIFGILENDLLRWIYCYFLARFFLGNNLYRQLMCSAITVNGFVKVV
jgi:hypothetical protein